MNINHPPLIVGSAMKPNPKTIELDEKKWASMPDEKTIRETAKSIGARGIKMIIVETGKNALEKIKELIPEGATVMNGSSTTLAEIGFMEYLESGNHKWTDMHKVIRSENDKQKRDDIRRKSATADYFLGSINAISKNGELVACDASGSRVTAYPNAAKNLILVAGVQKITPNLEQALQRIREYAYPKEDKRAKDAYGAGSTIGKCVIIEREIFEGRTTLILVKEKLGF